MELTTFNLEKTSFYNYLFDLNSIEDLTVEQFEKMMEQDMLRIIKSLKVDIEKTRFNIKRNDNEYLSYVKVLCPKEDDTQFEISLITFVEEINSVFTTNLQSYYKYIQSIKNDLATENEFNDIRVNPKTVLEVYNTVFDSLNEQLGAKMVFVVPMYANESSEIIGITTSFSKELVLVLQEQGENINANNVMEEAEYFVDSEEIARNVLSFLSDNFGDIANDQKVAKLSVITFLDIMYLMEDNTIAELSKKNLIIPVSKVESYLLQTVQQLEGIRIALNLGFKISYEDDNYSKDDDTLVYSVFMLSLSSEEIQELADEAEDEQEFVRFLLEEIDSQIDILKSFIVQEFPYLIQTLGNEASLLSSVLSNFKHNDTKNMSKIFAGVSLASDDILDLLMNNEGIEIVHVVDEIQRMSVPNDDMDELNIKDDNDTLGMDSN